MELAVEGFSHGQSPLRIQRPPCPIHTPNTSRPGHPISCILQHPRRETTRRVHRPHASSTPTAHHHHRWQLLPFPHSTIALAADPPGSSVRTGVYVSASRMHQHRRMWVAARRTRCRREGCVAERVQRRCERAGGAASSRAACAAGTPTHCAFARKRTCSPRAAPSFLARPCRSAGVSLVLMSLFVQLDTLHE